jgi:hypothetical protein
MLHNSRKKARTNNLVATKALAHKLARACYHILKKGKPFDAARCFAGELITSEQPGNTTGAKPTI